MGTGRCGSAAEDIVYFIFNAFLSMQTQEMYCAPNLVTTLVYSIKVLRLFCYFLGKGGYVFGSIDLFVFLSVCKQHYSKSYERIAMKFYEMVWGGERNK